ncbi:MAG TPA: hypothetical protein VK116_18820, partial [Planctomycetota bacterium]|nr:hypothetical protein [Planctomycetota bacterium]
MSAEPVAARDSESRLVVESRTIDPEIEEGHARLRLAIVEVDDADASDPAERPAPARVVVKAPGGVAIDGALRGVYDDGRFYVDGGFEVTVPAGSLDVSIAHGPEVEPLETALEIRSGERIEARAILVRWRRLSARGWRSGDLHVHARHDAVGAIRSDLAWMALQARANGLDFV